MMNDYISREAAADVLRRLANALDEQIGYPSQMADVCQGVILDAATEISLLPAADVEPVRHGRWIIRRGQDWPEWAIRIVCSECGLVTGEKSKYCPNCGAKMDLEEEP